MSRETADRRQREKERVKDRIKGAAAAIKADPATATAVAAAFLPHVAGAHDCLRYCPSESPAVAMLRALLLLPPEEEGGRSAGFLDRLATATSNEFCDLTVTSLQYQVSGPPYSSRKTRRRLPV